MRTSEQWRAVREAFEAVIDLQAAERGPVLDIACRGDAAVRAGVDALLRADAGEALEDAPATGLDAHLDQALVGTRIGTCTILRPIGVGGMGTVFEAEQDSPRRLVAVKILRTAVGGEALLARFRDEAERLAALRHPNVAQVHEAGVHEQPVPGGSVAVPFLVMETVRGASTLIAYAAERRLGAMTRLRLLLQVCDAMRRAHGIGLVHCDLKPANLLVDEDGVVKVIDFGIARVTADHGAGSANSERARGQPGTGRYMSPEQIAGARIDARTDVWALGVVLAELVPELSGDLAAIHRCATAADSASRYADAGELAADLRRLLQHEPVAAVGGGVAYRVRKFVRRHRVGLAAAFVVVAGVAFGLAGLAIGWRESERQRLLTAAKAAETGAVVEFLQEMLVSAQPWHGSGHLTVREVLERAAADLHGRFAEQPGIGAVLHHTIGWSLHGLGRTADAEPHLRRAIEVMATLPATGRRELLEIRKRHAVVLSELRRHAEAESILAIVAADAAASLGDDDAMTLAARGLHAIVLSALGRRDEAAAMLRQVIASSERRFGRDDRETIAHRNNLVGVLLALQRMDEAAVVADGAAAATERVFGAEHPNTHTAQQNLAAMHLRRGDFAASEQLTRDVLARREPLLGEEHPHTILSRYWLGAAVLGQGRFTEAEDLLADVLATARAILGEAHAHTQRIAFDRAKALRGLGRETAAEQCAQELVVAVAGRDDPAAAKLRAELQAFLAGPNTAGR